MPIVRSLRARVVLWVSVALTVLFAVTIVGLDKAFRDSTERALEDLLQVQLLGLIALAEPDRNGELMLPTDDIDPQFSVADSGLYGVVLDAEGKPLWQSLSLLGRGLPIDDLPEPGEQRYLGLEAAGLPPLEALLMGVTWEFADERVVPYTFGIAVSLEPYNARQAAFRRNLIGWFAGITVTMLIVIGGLLGWVFRPVRRLERQVREVDSGARAALTGEYPTELVSLAANLNALIDTERRRLVRYRNTLDDLAHSLKTPLAVMRSLLAEMGADGVGRSAQSRRRGSGQVGTAHVAERAPVLGAEVSTQVVALGRELDRMDQRVSYQLRRARAGGATGIGVEPVSLRPVIDDLRHGLDKVYRDKRVSCEVRVAGGAAFQGDPGDLTEVLGNLLDNAYKYCKRRVRVLAATSGGRLSIDIDDDGQGIDPAEVDKLLERGTRADESVPGHGLGLAVVREIVELYQGELSIGRSELGGASVRVQLARAGGSV